MARKSRSRRRMRAGLAGLIALGVGGLALDFAKTFQLVAGNQASGSEFAKGQGGFVICEGEFYLKVELKGRATIFQEPEDFVGGGRNCRRSVSRTLVEHMAGPEGECEVGWRGFGGADPHAVAAATDGVEHGRSVVRDAGGE